MMQKIFVMTIVTAILLVSTSGVAALTFPPLGISAVDKEINEVRNEIIRHINIAKATDIRPINGEWQGEYHQMYSTEKIYDITEFYFPSIKIDGFELHSIIIYRDGFGFRYAPIEELEKGTDFHDMYDTMITIDIDRPSMILDPAKPLETITEQAIQQGWGYLTEDNMVYSERLSDIFAQIGNTRFRLKVPNNLNNYEFLRDLSLKIIETSELIVLDNISVIAPKTGDNIKFIIILIAGVILINISRKNINFFRIE